MLCNDMTKAKNKGQTLILVVLLFSAVATTLVLGALSPLIREVQVVRNLEISKKSYFAAEAGSEDAYYRIKNNLPAAFPMTLSLDGATATVTTAVTGINEQEILSQANASNFIRTVLKGITVTDGFAFNFGVQVGIGGLYLKNNSVVVGNVYANGPVQGDDKDKNFIFGDVVSASSTGSVSNIHATSSAYAHTITTAIIDRDAYYENISLTTVGGVQYPNSPDQPTASMPIPDSLIDQWEADALAGGAISTPCPYHISSSTTLGPKKINCDVTVSGNNTVLTLSGTIWINGNLAVDDKPTFKVSDVLGNKSVPVITHATADPVNRGIISVSNSPTFYGSVSNGSPNPDSYIMFISRNTSAELGGSVKAVTVGNNATGNLLLYAPHGEVELLNNVTLRQVTAHTLTLKNNTRVYYSAGLSQPLFVSGPGGKWKIKSWKESKE